MTQIITNPETARTSISYHQTAIKNIHDSINQMLESTHDFSTSIESLYNEIEIHENAIIKLTRKYNL